MAAKVRPSVCVTGWESSLIGPSSVNTSCATFMIVRVSATVIGGTNSCADRPVPAIKAMGKMKSAALLITNPFFSNATGNAVICA